MLNGVVFLAILGIAVYGIKNQTRGEVLSVQQSNCVKGLAAIVLVLVHIGNSLENPGFYKILSSGGYLLVGVFFFYSGYGIVFQSMRRSDYFQQRLPQRIIHLVKLVIVTELIYLLVHIFVLGEKKSISEIILHTLGIDLLNGAMWYIVALIIILISFFLVSQIKVCRDKYTLSAIIAMGIYILLSILRQAPPHEMQSCVGFVAGVFLAENKNRVAIFKTSKRKLFMVSAICGMLFVMAFFAPYIVRVFTDDFAIVRVVCGTIATVTFLGVMFLFLSRYSINNCLLVFLGGISTEIYLSHQLIINVLEHFVPKGFAMGHEVLISVVVIFFVLVVSISINKIKFCVKKMVKH